MLILQRQSDLSPIFMHNQRKAYLLAALSVMCWSTIAVAFKTTLRFTDPFQIVFIASLVSWLTFALIAIFRNGIRALIGGIKMKDLLRSAMLGFLNPFFYYIVLIHAYDMISAQEAMTLNYIWPIVLALLSVPMLGQKLGLASLVAMVISFAGIVVIATRGEFASLSFSGLYGNFLAAGSSIIWALYWILNLKDKREIPTAMALNFFFGTLYAFAALLIFSTPAAIPVRGWLGGTYLGLFEMGITFLLWLSALKFSRKTYLVSQFIFISPFLSLIWIRVVLGEPLLRSTILGLVLVLSGIFIQQQQDRRSRKSI
jgi:drug/metabolite transporter (DMT)-like permease